MEFKLGHGVAIALPPLPITVVAILIIFLLVRWSKQLETRRFTVFFYFLISTYIAPIYSHGKGGEDFVLWIPLGFMVVLLYLFLNKRNHPPKIKASILGFCLAIYQLILQYVG